MSSGMNVAVLAGGRSLERQVSLVSGARVADALERLGHRAALIDAGHDLVAQLREREPDVVFVALHGGDGEDGTVQELLEVLGLRYTGSRPAACVRSWDKVLAKELLRDAGVPTPDDLVFSESAVKELGAADALDVVEERLGFPVVVKPACQGSALGVRFAASAAEVPGALIAAFSYSAKVLVERYVHGRELAVSLLGDEPLPVVEAEPHEEDFYDFEARYTIGRTTFHCPAELDGGVEAEVQELAVRTAGALGLTGFARVDLLLDREDGALFVLEANAIPGLTETSLLPLAAEAAGIGFDAFVERSLELALQPAA
jgi:D-alanine-D-alanine ligase